MSQFHRPNRPSKARALDIVEVSRASLGAAGSSIDAGLLIDDKGRWVGTRSPEFRAMVGDPNPDYDAVMLAVKTLGFIAVTIRNATMEVVLNVKNVEAQAIDALVPMLASSSGSLFRILYLAECWYEETATLGLDAAKRVVALCGNERIAQRE